MNRRELLTMIAAVTGTSMMGAHRAFAYQPTPVGENLFSEADAEFLDTVAETIIPATDTPGAREAGVGAFMTVYVSDCYTSREQANFREGMEQIRTRAETDYGKPFEEMSTEERQELLQTAADEARAFTSRRMAELEERREQSIDQQSAADTAADEQPEEAAEPEMHWFTPIQQLTLFGFFTSEVGGTEVLRYEQVPGEYIGDLDYDGGPAWAT
ncbi:gluconate 2-dehydrogenase subunit 3 family protein [Palleronia sp. LCG004]|uniref:gluconate 2-dehydrogenase subunit 3 family protein n=1 Tax=Palleronia sp. LCG004 TaxID=3079304 RepID=UPI002941FEFF|nr:gluconate 2-dehydrogenase subunit 3 family protein [Palleronia sp. LCG004]WOI58010.1 gluconate 2-dehydrogenase subunit 3 family protein [Palleronia sp. LCG004]